MSAWDLKNDERLMGNTLNIPPGITLRFYLLEEFKWPKKCINRPSSGRSNANQD